MIQLEATYETVTVEERCEALWAAVVLQGIRDALRPTLIGASDKENAVMRARTWLASTDFDICCDYAGLDPASTRAKANRWLEGVEDYMILYPYINAGRKPARIDIRNAKKEPTMKKKKGGGGKKC